MSKGVTTDFTDFTDLKQVKLAQRRGERREKFFFLLFTPRSLRLCASFRLVFIRAIRAIRGPPASSAF
jgi:hypothetical protein